MKKLLLFLLYIAFTVTSSLAQDKLPNFVVILTDDQGYGDLSCFGSNNVQTPRIDQRY